MAHPKPLSRVRIKICGITRAQDAQAAVELGVDAIGLNFYPPSPRSLRAQAAAAIVASLPPFVATVGLFVNPTEDEVRDVLKAAGISLLQFHGTELPGFCAGFGVPYVKSVGMSGEVDLEEAGRRYASASALLLDAFDPVLWGGTGRAFDWGRVPGDLAKPVVLAGGLDAGNVGRAIDAIRPYAVDVCGGVESAPGVKDPDKMASFVGAVARALEYRECAS